MTQLNRATRTWPITLVQPQLCEPGKVAARKFGGKSALEIRPGPFGVLHPDDIKQKLLLPCLGGQLFWIFGLNEITNRVVAVCAKGIVPTVLTPQNNHSPNHAPNHRPRRKPFLRQPTRS